MHATSRRMILGVLFLVLAAGVADAQINSSINTVPLNWNENENLNIQLNIGSGNQFTQVGTALQPTTSPITVTAAYNGLTNRATLTIWAYFTDAASALSNGSASVAASQIQASIDGGATSFFTTSSPFSNASVRLNQTPLASQNGTLASTFSLAIFGNHPAGFYTGTMIIQLQAL